jgi:hypothetical protein
MGSPRVTYAQHPGITPEAELSAIAAVYLIVLSTRGRLPDESAPDDGSKSKEDSADEHRST